MTFSFGAPTSLSWVRGHLARTLLTNLISRFAILLQSLALLRVPFQLHQGRMKSRRRLRGRRRHSVRKSSRCYDGADAAPRDSSPQRSLCVVARALERLCKSPPETNNKG